MFASRFCAELKLEPELEKRLIGGLLIQCMKNTVWEKELGEVQNEFHKAALKSFI